MLLDSYLPVILQCATIASPGRYAGAVVPGNDIISRDIYQDRFVMQLQTFSTPEQVSGLLMFDRGRGGRISSTIPTSPEHIWFFFGYLCERCRSVFLLPNWVHSVDDLPRAIHHSCHGDGMLDYPQRFLRDRVNEAAVVLMNKLLVSNLIGPKDAGRAAQLIAAFNEVAMTKIQQEMDNLQEEKRKGRY